MTTTSFKPQAVIVRPRVYIGEAIALGPGKIDLLREIGETHSISAAARTLGIPYKRAWLLVDSLNEGFGRPVILTTKGGKGGGGTALTQLGEELLHRYTALEQRINQESARELEALRALTD
ncbi:MAG: ModE family transcriptional regulator [Gallionellales bacterium RBG_16_56_9]|nr:MAG: ModE family transcriptional regulator [Gallionellales bacterium RBG_16_56_9]